MQQLSYQDRVEELREDLKQYVSHVQFAHAPSLPVPAAPSSHELDRLQFSVDALHAKLDHLAAREAAMEQLQGSVDLLHRRLDKVLGPS